MVVIGKFCEECMQLYTTESHLSCNTRRFKRNFENWTSGNKDIDNLIQNSQLYSKNHREVLEWIEYDRFENIEYLAKGGFGTVYKAIWKNGYIESWDSKNNQWKREEETEVALKCLHKSQGITAEFLGEVRFFLMVLIFYE